MKMGTDAWMDFNEWKAHKEFIDELNGNPMANIITKDKKIRDQVDRHMRNSIEYENPNLKKKLNMNFPSVKNEDIQKALNVQDITRIFQSRSYLSLGSVVVDHTFKGYVTYRRKPIDWSKEEIKMEFNGTQDFAQEFDKIPS